MPISKKNSYHFVACLLLAAISCNTHPDEKDQGPPPPPTELADVTVPEFNENVAFELVKQQVAFGPRVPNTKGHKACGDFLIKTLQQWCDTVYVQATTVTAFDKTPLQIRNIIGSFNPAQKRRILLCAHWDTRPFSDQDPITKTKPIDGANDGGSGVAVLLQLAELFSKQQPNIGIDIILFDAEDYGQPDAVLQQEQPDTYCLGSQYWSRNPHLSAYTADYGILLDMVGGVNARFAKEGVSMTYAPHVVEKVWKTAARIGYGNVFINETTRPITDDHYYINRIAGIPVIDIIENDNTTRSGFNKHWHTLSDTPENISPATLKAVGQTLLEVVYREK